MINSKDLENAAQIIGVSIILHGCVSAAGATSAEFPMGGRIVSAASIHDLCAKYLSTPEEHRDQIELPLNMFDWWPEQNCMNVIQNIEPAGDDGRQHEAIISNGVVTFTATEVIE